MLTDPGKEIDKFRKEFSSYSRSQLIAEIKQHEEFSPRHIVAIQLLDEMDKIDSNKQHKETLDAAKGANRWAMLAFIVALFSLLAFVGDWIYKHFRSSSQTKPKIEVVTPKPISQPSTKDTVSPSNDQTRKPQEPPETRKTKH